MIFTEKERAFALKTKNYLQNKTMKFSYYEPEYPNDHTYCVFCWACFSNAEFDLHEGFLDEETESWVCEFCLEDFENEMHWTVDRSARKRVFDTDWLDEVIY